MALSLSTIKIVFPQSTTQICIVHQIRYTCKYVVWKDRKDFTKDIKANIYGVPRKQAASKLLRSLIRNGRSSYAIKSWQNNWDELTAFYEFPVEIRKIIYTTNLNGKIRLPLKKDYLLIISGLPCF